ncbi:MAG: dephospho-CoA kinase [Streptosporangiales bacterium]
MLRVGLTGGIGSGKSEVTSRLRELGAVVIDSDVLAREVVRAGTPGFEQVVAEFGEDVLGPDGELDRPRLGRLIFADPDRRKALEGIVHPLVRARVNQIASAAADDAVVVNDVPLLVESGLQGTYDLVVVVDAPPEVQRDRLVRLRGMSPEDARARIAAQAPRADRLAAADIVVDNSGDLDVLDGQVAALWERLEARG